MTAGMTFEELVKARRFGVSQKNSSEHVGFRGIGIYSGYDLCNRLLITSYSGRRHDAKRVGVQFLSDEEAS